MSNDSNNHSRNNPSNHNSNDNSNHSTSKSNDSNSGNDQRTLENEPGRFIALDVSYRLIEALARVVPAIQKHDRDLADQIRRAASSVSLNLAEGQRSLKGNRQRHYSIAHGSANEVKAGLFVAKAWGWVGSSDEALAILDRLLALLWRLTHRGA